MWLLEHNPPPLCPFLFQKLRILPKYTEILLHTQLPFITNMMWCLCIPLKRKKFTVLLCIGLYHKMTVLYLLAFDWGWINDSFIRCQDFKTSEVTLWPMICHKEFKTFPFSSHTYTGFFYSTDIVSQEICRLSKTVQIWKTSQTKKQMIKQDCNHSNLHGIHSYMLNSYPTSCHPSSM